MITLLTNHYSIPLSSGSRSDVKGNPLLVALAKRANSWDPSVPRGSEPIGLGLGLRV